MGMKMAKASQQEIEMALKVCRLLEDVLHDEQLVDDEGESEWFDPDYKDDLRQFYDRLKAIYQCGGMMRVVFGFAVLMDPDNKIVDPDQGVLEMHPRFAQAQEAVALLRQIVADRPGGFLEAAQLLAKIDEGNAELLLPEADEVEA
jgi:hypothetical protein